MIRFKDILSEIKIQPNYIPDPIKAKGLKVGDKIEWIGWLGYKEQDTIIKITYYKFNYINPIPSWKEADFVRIETYISYLNYYKNPRNDGFHDDQLNNKEFDSIKKI